MRLLHPGWQALRFAPKAHARLQFVVRTSVPAGDRAFSHVFREGAALAGLRGEGKSRLLKRLFQRLPHAENSEEADHARNRYVIADPAYAAPCLKHLRERW